MTPKLRSLEDLEALETALDKMAAQMLENSRDPEEAENKQMWERENLAYWKAAEAVRYALGKKSLFDKMMEKVRAQEV